MQFELIDQGYAMCLVDDGTGTGTKVAKYFVDADGNYYELYTYVLFSPNGGVIETSTFTLKVTLGAPANPQHVAGDARDAEQRQPAGPASRRSTRSRTCIYAAFGPSSPGSRRRSCRSRRPAARREVQAGTIIGPPGFNGYDAQRGRREPPAGADLATLLGGTAYPIAGTTTIVPLNAAKQKAVPFYGSLSHGLDKQVSQPALYSRRPRRAHPAPDRAADRQLRPVRRRRPRRADRHPVQLRVPGLGRDPAAVATGRTPGHDDEGDDTVFYTVNAPLLGVDGLDRQGRRISAASQYFVDETDPANPIYGVVTLPTFSFNGNTYTVNLTTTLADGVTLALQPRRRRQELPLRPRQRRHVDVDSNNTTVAVDNTSSPSTRSRAAPTP